jgi:thiosulfate/3-mercaptopyruvate sulfurtransferase
MYGTLIDVDSLAPRVVARSVVLFDCRFDLADTDAGERAFREGHIPGAHYLHLDRDLSASPSGSNGRHPLPDRARLVARLRDAGLDVGGQVVAYDDAGGAYAARLWWLLRWLGHAQVAVLDGGIQAWTARGLPLAAGEADTASSGGFEAGLPLVETADVDDLVRNLATGERLVVDARSAARFAGAPHPLDALPGHLPGARNRFFGDNLGEDGRFKSAAALRADYAAVLQGTPAEQAVLHCGSGVTACHDLLAMEVAGLTGARLYPGSWSEWTSDPARPIARD